MNKFEVGMIIEKGYTYIVEKVTKSFVTFKVVEHFNRCNERIVKNVRVKKEIWKIGEVAIINDLTIEAC